MIDQRGLLTRRRVEQMRAALRKRWSTQTRWVKRVIGRRLQFYGLVVALDMLAVAAAFQLAAVERFLHSPLLAREFQYFLLPSALIGWLYATISYLLGLHRRLWRYADLRDMLALLQAVGMTMALVIGLEALAGASLRPATGVPRLYGMSLGVVATGALLSFVFVGAVKVLPPTLRSLARARSTGATTRVLIVGAGEAGAALAARLLLNTREGYQVVAFVDDDAAKWRRSIHGRPIFGPTEAIPIIVKRSAIDLIAIALPSASVERISRIIALCQQTPASIKILPGLNEVVGHHAPSPLLREVNVADLLGRPIVPLHAAEAHDFLDGKTILVTGAAGSIGSELCRQLITYGPAAVIAVDNNETGLFDLAERLRAEPNAARLRVRIADVTDRGTIARVLAQEQPDVLYHAAAYKHVPLLEDHPDQAIRTNVLGTYELCRLAREHGVSRFVFVSSDKAAEPASVLGASKRLGELVVQAMAQSGEAATRFCAVRFGNVIGSRGSVVPLFTQQIEQGGPVTITDAEATRYFMTIPEACGLVILASTFADSGSLYLLDMGEPVRIADLAVKMIRLRGLRVGHDVPVVYTGLRRGERLHERLTAADERLLPTAHRKILQVTHDGETATLAAIEAWMQSLRDGLGHDAGPALRERLLDLARVRVPA